MKIEWLKALKTAGQGEAKPMANGLVVLKTSARFLLVLALLAPSFGIVQNPRLLGRFVHECLSFKGVPKATIMVPRTEMTDEIFKFDSKN